MHDENQLLLKNSNLIYDTLIKLKKKTSLRKLVSHSIVLKN